MGDEMDGNYVNLEYIVALCTFNGERFVSEQIQSIQGQTIPPKELIISDDGSDDRTLEIVESYASKCTIPIKIIFNKGEHGVRGNFYTAIQSCSYPIIFTCDQDDVWLPQKAETVLPYFADKTVQLVFSDGELVNGELESLGTSIFHANGITEKFLKEKDWISYLYSNFLVTGATMAFRSSLMDNVSQFPEGWLHDSFLAFKAAAMGGMVACEERLILYRQHGSNTLGMHEVTRAERLEQWKQRSKNLVSDRDKRYHRFLTLNEELHSCFTQEEQKRMDRFLSFLQDLAEAGRKPALIQIPTIVKHYCNGDFQEFYSGGKTAVLAILAAFISKD